MLHIIRLWWKTSKFFFLTPVVVQNLLAWWNSVYVLIEKMWYCFSYLFFYVEPLGIMVKKAFLHTAVCREVLHCHLWSVWDGVLVLELRWILVHTISRLYLFSFSQFMAINKIFSVISIISISSSWFSIKYITLHVLGYFSWGFSLT